MKLHPTFTKGLSLATSALLLSGAVALFTPETIVEVEGAGEIQGAKMGSTFEDMSAGVLTAIETTETTHADPPQQIAITQSETLQTVLPTPPVIARVIPTGPKPVVTQQTAPIAQAPPTQTIKSTAPEGKGLRLSARPKRRNDELAAEAASKAAGLKPLQQPAKPKAQRGNAKRNNTQGSTAGTSKTKTAKTQGSTARKTTQSGNAAASNYPGQVMRRISRVSKPRIRSRGVAVIAFSVSSRGGLGQLSLTRSSGSDALDQAALAVIRKAAPFPAPPTGAQRQFSIKIKGG